MSVVSRPGNELTHSDMGELGRDEKDTVAPGGSPQIPVLPGSFLARLGVLLHP